MAVSKPDASKQQPAIPEVASSEAVHLALAALEAELGVEVPEPNPTAPPSDVSQPEASSDPVARTRRGDLLDSDL